MMIDDDVGLKEEPEDTRYYIKMRPEALGVWANYMLCHYWELYFREWACISLPDGTCEDMDSIPRGPAYYNV